MKVLAFGIAKEIMGGGTAEVPVSKGMTVGVLKAAMELQYPALKNLTSFALAVNGEYASADVVINESDELAIIPPVSGG
jgi:molybdopterin synthase sulfur carrier subunit